MLDGIPALDLWDVIVAVLHGNTYQSNQEEQCDLCTNPREVRAAPHTLHKRKKSHGVIDDPDNVDFISSNVNSSRQQALLYVPSGPGAESFFEARRSLHIRNIYAKKKGIARKLILNLRAIMISQEVDLVAGDFNGTAWRCRSRENLSTIDEAFTDCALPTPPTGPHTVVVTRIHCEQLGRCMWISQTTGFSTLLDSGQTWCLLHPLESTWPETE